MVPLGVALEVRVMEGVPLLERVALCVASDVWLEVGVGLDVRVEDRVPLLDRV